MSGSIRSTTSCSREALPARGAAAPSARRARPAHRRAHSVHRQHAVRQHDPRRRSSPHSRESGARTPHQEPRPLERDGDGRAGQQAERRHRRAHLHLRLGRDALRGRLQPLLPRPRPTTQDGDIVYFQGHAAPGIYARAFLEGRLSRQQLENFRRELATGRRPVVLSAPLADARLLAVPHRVDGPRARSWRSTRPASTATSRTAA